MRVSELVAKVLNGESPRALIEAMTPGLTAARSRIPKIASVCKGCGLEVPTYSGRYPNNCPECKQSWAGGGNDHA